jgi:hypothetical protein
MAQNPYQPPKAKSLLPDAAVPAAITPDAGELLCSPVQLLAAGILGGPLAGAWLARTNYNAIGQPDEGFIVVGWSLAALIPVVGIMILLPGPIPWIVLPPVFGLAIRALAEMKFGAIVRQHRAEGGLLISWPLVIGTALLNLAISVTLFYLAVFILSAFGLGRIFR